MLPRLVRIFIFSVFIVVAVVPAKNGGHAYPVGKEHSEFLRKVGAALGDLAAVVLEMNDPYVLQRLSSKDQAHQFLVNILQAEENDGIVPLPASSHRPYFEEEDPRGSRWSYNNNNMGLRNLDPVAEEDSAAAASASATNQEADESSPSSSSSSEQQGYDLPMGADDVSLLQPVEGTAFSSAKASATGGDVMTAESDDDDDSSSSSSSSASDEDDSSSSSSEEEDRGNPGVMALRLAQGDQRSRKVPSAEVPCSDEEDEVQVNASGHSVESRSGSSEQQKPVGGVDGRGLLEQLVRQHLWALLREATGRQEYEHNARIHAAVDFTARKIVVDILQTTP